MLVPGLGLSVERSAKWPASGSAVWTRGAPGASASSSVVTAGSSSYAISISSRAWAAALSLSATTAATGSPS